MPCSIHSTLHGTRSAAQSSLAPMDIITGRLQCSVPMQKPPTSPIVKFIIPTLYS